MFIRKATASDVAAADEILNAYPDEKNIIIDFHAEATSEKAAMAYYLDGKITCLFGTHTHVATADETIPVDTTVQILEINSTKLKVKRMEE